MTIEELKDLFPGDTIYWKDPDENRCSGLIKILDIEIIDEDTVCIIDVNQSVTEAHLDELFMEPPITHIYGCDDCRQSFKGCPDCRRETK